VTHDAIELHAAYLRELDARLAQALGANLVGTYVIGSAALGDFVDGASDLDVAAVCSDAPSSAALDAVEARAGHPALACPARLLELVVYSRESLARSPVEYELNLNSGEGMATRASRRPADSAAFWFTIDLARSRERAVPLRGPDPSTVFPQFARADVLDALYVSLDWHAAHELPPRQVLAACGAWMYAESGRLGSKREAVEWAAARSSDPDAVRAALAARDGGDEAAVGAEAAARVVAAARTALTHRRL
jgi:streptomycin 3"-adenylyltransferase